jgi:hypothetical protein
MTTNKTLQNIIKEMMLYRKSGNSTAQLAYNQCLNESIEIIKSHMTKDDKWIVTDLK